MMRNTTTTDGNNDPALLLPLSSYADDHATTTQTKNKDKDKNKTNKRNVSSSLLQFKIIFTFVLIFGVGILSTFIQVIPLIIGNNPRQLSTHTILKTTPSTSTSTSTTLRTAAAAKTAATAVTATSTKSNINGNNSHDSNNNNRSSNPISSISISTPIHQNKTKTKTKKFFDPTQITTVYHLGHKRAYGRSNNQIVTILHAIDIALDNSNGNNTDTVVVAVSKWAFDILKGLLYNGWEGKKGKEFALQLEQLPSVVLLVHEDRLEALNLSSATNNKKNNNSNNNNTIIQHIYLDTKATYFYIEKNMYWNNIISVKNIEQRRTLILGQFFEQIGIADRNLVLYNIVQNYINTNNYRQINNISSNSNISNSSSISNSKSKSDSNSNSNSDSNVMNTKYVTIHSRWLEGECERRVGDLLPAKDECWMTPSYIKDIIAGLNSGGNGNGGNGNDGEDTDLSIGNNNINQPPIAIVFISDGQNKEVLINLKNDPDIGPSIIVPRDIIETSNTNDNNNQKSKSYDDIVLWWTQPWNDMMVAIHSDIFIGTRSSTFATIVGMSRIAIGKDPKTNYIYTEQKKLITDRSHYSASVQQQQQQQQENKEQQSNIIIDVCEECLFLCNKSQSHLCGHDIIFS